MPGTDAPPPNDAAAAIDTTKPSIARVYDAGLGGKDNYEVDREFVRQLETIAPEVTQIARQNRAFLIRVCRFLASTAGIDQYLDCGSGLPTAENVHQVVQRINPDTSVVYIDNDPVVIAHGRALLEENDHTHFTGGDIFKPQEILNNEVVCRHIDFSRPLAFFQVATMHSYGGSDPARIMREYIDALPSGSFVGFSHFFDPENEHHDLAKRIEHLFETSRVDFGNFRRRAEIAEMLHGLELVEPGLVHSAEWWPDGPLLAPLTGVQQCHVGAVGRKP